MRNFKFHYDAAHAWLKVHKMDLLDVDMVPQNFSAYSYTDGEWLYLEEDCDAGKFLSTYEKRFGGFKITEIDDGYDSPIRSLPRNQ